MYLSELKIWNFRKLGSSDDGKTPGLSLKFNKGLNLLVGENDSGKTCIVDAIKHVLLTESHEFHRIQYEDFHLEIEKTEGNKNRAKELKIECIFRGFKIEEARHFLKWAGIEKDDSGKGKYCLRVWLKANRKNRKVYVDFKAGSDDNGKSLGGKARDLLRAVYLKPLRDAENELSSGRSSRLSKVLDSHKAFKEKDEHTIMSAVEEANNKIEGYFKGSSDDKSGKTILESINTYLEAFSNQNNPLNSDISIADMDLKSILEKLSLSLSEHKVGLGSENILFIAAEFLLLQRVDYTGLKLALIEEIEAHLHPQAQLRLVEYLQNETDDLGVQLILTSHSPILASTIKLRNLIVVKDGDIFPMGKEFTKLLKGDYLFLERFLNSTKSNLFFAQGVILVEGDAENLLIPTIASIIDLPLSKYGVSIVNVGSTAFLRYSRIFQRQNDERMQIPVACITDCDVKPNKNSDEDDSTFIKIDEYNSKIKEAIETKQERYDGQTVKTFVSPDWTLEYVLALSGFTEEFYKAVLYAEKIKNSDEYGLTKKKEKKCNKKVEENLGKWRGKGWSKEKIAFEIYNNIMLDKSISKAITAQCFAKILNKLDKEEVKNRIKEDDKLKYIVEALNHVSNQGDNND